MISEGRIPENHLDGDGQPLDMAVIEGLRGMGVRVEGFFHQDFTPTNKQLSGLYDGLVKLRRIYPDATGLEAFRDTRTIHRSVKEIDEWLASNGLEVSKANCEKWLRQKFQEAPTHDDIVAAFVFTKMRRMDREDPGLFSTVCNLCGVVVHKVNKADARFQMAEHKIACGNDWLSICPASSISPDARMVDGSKCCDASRGMQA